MGNHLSRQLLPVKQLAHLSQQLKGLNRLHDEFCALIKHIAALFVRSMS